MEMRNVVLLLKGVFGGMKLGDFLAFRNREGVKKKGGLFRTAGSGVMKLFLGICIMVGFGSWMMMFGFTFYSLESLGVVLGRGPGLGLVFASLISSLAIFVFSFLMSADMLFKGKDMALIRTLPVTELEIVVSRMAAMYLYMLPLNALITIPGIVTYCMLNPFSFSMITGSLLILFLGPAASIALCSLLSAVTCRLGGRGPGKVVSQVVVFLMIIALLGFLQVGNMEKLGRGMTEADFNAMGGTLSFVSTHLDSMIKALPTCVWMAGTMAPGTAVVDSLLTIALRLCLFALSSVLVARMFYPITASFETGQKARRRKTRLGNGVQSPEYRQRSAVRALVSKDWYILKSSSAFVTEIVSEALVPLILLVVWGVMGTLGTMTSGLSSLKSSVFFPLIICGILMFFQGMGMVSSTSVSREGKLFSLNMVYPLDASLHIKAKLIVHLIALWLPSFIYTVIVAVLFGISLPSTLMIVVFNMMFSVAMCFQGLSIDYSNPYLTWKNPQQAVKQNTNGLKAMGLCAFQVVLMGAVCYLLFRAAGHALAVLWIAVFLIAADMVSFRIASKAVKGRLG